LIKWGYANYYIDIRKLSLYFIAYLRVKNKTNQIYVEKFKIFFPKTRTMNLLKYDYLPNDCLFALKTYRYQGLDHSLLYKYIFSPIAESCLSITPSYLA
jgi:hypothetical protein